MNEKLSSYLEPILESEPQHFINIPARPEYNRYTGKYFDEANPFKDDMILEPYVESFEYHDPSAHLNKLGSFAMQSLITQTVKNVSMPRIQQPILPPNTKIQFKPTLTPTFGLNHDRTQPHDLPEMALPVLDFIEAEKPHVVIGCDRGGRLFSVAMHAAWQQTRQGRPFPTLDGKLHFARISKSEDEEVLQEKVDKIIAAAKQFGAQRGNVLDEDEQMRVLFVDDWIVGGGTKRLTERLMAKHNAKTYFAVMTGSGNGEVATGQPVQNTMISWHDLPEVIGVNYLSELHWNGVTSTVSQSQEAVIVHAPEAKAGRRAIHRAAKNLQTTAKSL